MRFLRILGIAFAGFIVFNALLWSIFVIARSSGSDPQNAVPAQGRHAVSPTGDVTLISQNQGNSSFLYRKNPLSGRSERLTTASSGLESEPSFSHDGKYVVYTFAGSPNGKGSVWVISADGHNPHQVSGKDDDALHPVFAPDGSKVFFAISAYTGNHSPVVRPARHDWDVFAVDLQSDSVPGGTVQAQITHQSFYDLMSLDAAEDGVNPGHAKLLISTSGYPIGPLLEEFRLGDKGRNGIFQPHVPGESKIGPAYGEAQYFHDGQDILFLAASDGPSGNYDYNVYSMSEVTGSELKQLTHLKGVTTDLKVLPDGKVTFLNAGTPYLLDIETQALKSL